MCNSIIKNEIYNIEPRYINVYNIKKDMFECIDDYEEITKNFVAIIYIKYNNAPYWVNVDNKGVFYIDYQKTNNINNAIEYLKKFIIEQQC